MSVKSYAERLDASYQQEAVERRQHSSGGVLYECDLFCKLPCLYDCQSCHNIAVSAEILGRRVYDYICTKFERSLQIRCHKGVVNYYEQPVLVSYLCCGTDVGDGHQRICGAFDKDSFDIGGDVLFKRCRILGIGDRIGYAEAVEYFVKQSERSAIDV